jgi:hypothetical protein
MTVTGERDGVHDAAERVLAFQLAHELPDEPPQPISGDLFAVTGTPPADGTGSF